jgi:hypothetical protein
VCCSSIIIVVVVVIVVFYELRFGKITLRRHDVSSLRRGLSRADVLSVVVAVVSRSTLSHLVGRLKTSARQGLLGTELD